MNLALIAEIILEGLKLLNKTTQDKLKEDHHDAIIDLNMARNAHFPEYNDIDTALAKQRLDALARAYLNELKTEGTKLL